MSMFPDRPATALVVIDVQKGVIGECVQADEILPRIETLVDRAREAGASVVWVQHSSRGLPKESAGWELAGSLAPRPGEARVEKRYGDAFEATNLEEELARRGVGKLVVAGCQSDACIRSTIHGGFTRGYDVTLVGDAHTTSDKTSYGAPSPEGVIAHTNLYWSFQGAPGRKAAVTPTADVDFAAD